MYRSTQNNILSGNKELKMHVVTQKINENNSHKNSKTR